MSIALSEKIVNKIINLIESSRFTLEYGSEDSDCERFFITRRHKVSDTQWTKFIVEATYYPKTGNAVCVLDYDGSTLILQMYEETHTRIMRAIDRRIRLDKAFDRESRTTVDNRSYDIITDKDLAELEKSADLCIPSPDRIVQ